MDLYERVLVVARRYLGKRAERFINRQCRGHLGIEPNMLGNEHLDELARWCYMSGMLIMYHVESQEFGQKIRALKTE